MVGNRLWLASALLSIVITVHANSVSTHITTQVQPKTITLYPNLLPIENDVASHAFATTKAGADKPSARGDAPTAKARTADPLNHRAGTTGDDAESRIRTIFFETVAACIGLATLITAVLALRRMPKQKQPDPESPPLGRNSYLPSQHAELEPTQNWGEPVELDAVQTAVELQCEEPAIRDFNVQATVHPSGSTAMTGRTATLDDQTDLQPTSK